MFNKKMLWAALVLAIVVAIIVVGNSLSNRKPSEKSLKFFPTLTEGSIASFTITEGANTVTITRKGDTWIVASPAPRKEAAAAPAIGPGSDTAKAPAVEAAKPDYVADSASVASALEKLVNMKREDLVSSNPGKQAALEVDSAKGVLVEVVDSKGAKAGAVRIGKSGADWASHFVRSVGSNDVWAVGGSIKYAFFAEQNRWKDKTIQHFVKNDATKLTLAKKGGFAVSMDKSTDSTGEKWTIVAPEKKKAKKDVVDNMLNTLSSFRTDEWEENSSLSNDSMGFTTPELAITVSVSNGAEKRVTIGTKKGDAKKFWVRSDEKPGFTFLVDENTIAGLDKSLSDLTDEPKPAEPAKDKKEAKKAKKK